MGPHIREGVKKHDMFIEPKSYKFKLLGKLVIQHSIHKIIWCPINWFAYLSINILLNKIYFNPLHKYN